MLFSRSMFNSSLFNDPDIKISLNALASVSTSGLIVKPGSASISGAATLSVTGIAVRLGQANPAAAATVTSSGLAVRLGPVSINAAGVISVDADIVARGTVNIAGAGVLSVSGLKIQFGSSAITSGSTLSATAQSVKPGSFSLSAPATAITITPLAVRLGTANMSGVGVTVGIGNIVANGAFSLASGSTLNIVPVKINFGNMTLNGTATITVPGQIVKPASFGLTSAATVSATARGVKQASAGITGAATISITPVKVNLGSSGMSATGTITISGLRVGIASTSITGRATQTITGTKILFGPVAILSNTTISITPAEPEYVIIPTRLITWREILLRELDLSALGFTLLRETNRDVIPAVKNRKIAIPGRNGEIFLGNTISERLIELSLALNCDTEADYIKAKRALEAALNPAKGPVTIRFGDDPTKIYTGRYVGNINLQEWIMNGNFTIPLKMADPYVYNDQEKVFAGVGTVTNSGTQPAELTITIVGPLSTGSKVYVGSQTFTFNQSLLAGESVTFNSKTAQAMKGTTNVLNDMVGEFPILPVGDSSVDLKNSSNVSIGTSSNIELRYTEKFL